MNSQDRAKRQSTEEWVQENKTGIPVTPQGRGESQREVVPPGQLEFVYHCHRTAVNKSTGKGFLILCFVDVQSDQDAFVFFNVDTTIQRGSSKGNNHRIGHKGQFLPAPRSNFRRFWTRTVGKEPRRWSAVHKELSSKLKGLSFTAKTSAGSWPDGKPYIKLSNLMRREQYRNNNGTTREQLCNREWEQCYD